MRRCIDFGIVISGVLDLAETILHAAIYIYLAKTILHAAIYSHPVEGRENKMDDMDKMDKLV